MYYEIKIFKDKDFLSFKSHQQICQNEHFRAICQNDISVGIFFEFIIIDKEREKKMELWVMTKHTQTKFTTFMTF